jgi:uncharacterized protein YndB with AHSA1/START domain
MIPDSIQRDIVIDAPPDRVWAAITEARHLATWFADDGAEIEREIGGQVLLRWKEHGTALGVIEEFDPPRTFSMRWSLVDTEPPRPGNSTRVRFTLEPRGGGGTLLTVVESGFRSLEGDAAEKRRHLETNTEGWEAALAGLRGYLTPLPAR